MVIKSGVLAALGVKALAGGAAVALAAGGAVAATAATGSANPVQWGQGVAQAVERCKDEVRGQQASSSPDEHGVGRCVSAIARQHGEQQHDSTSADQSGRGASPSPLPGKREGQEAGGPSGGIGNGAGAGGAGKPAADQSAGSPGKSGEAGQGNRGQSQPTPRSSPKS